MLPFSHPIVWRKKLPLLINIGSVESIQSTDIKPSEVLKSRFNQILKPRFSYWEWHLNPGVKAHLACFEFVLANICD